MAAPGTNQQTFYFGEHEEIVALFDAEPIDGDQLIPRLVEALEDPFVPRHFRAEYEAMLACVEDVKEARECIARAREVIDDMRQVLEAAGRSTDQIDERLAAIVEMVDTVEEGLNERIDEYGRTRQGSTSKLMWRSEDEGSEGDPRDEGPTEGPATILAERTREATPDATFLPTPPATIRRQPPSLSKPDSPAKDRQ